MTSQRCNAIFFDLDGTLVDSAPGIEYAVQAAWAEAQPGSTCPPIRSLMGPPIRTMFQRALPAATPEVLTRLEGSFRRAYYDEGWRRTAAFPGVPEALAELRSLGMQCFGVTNKPALPTQRILSHCGLDRFFEAFFSPDSRQPAFATKTAATRALLEEWRLDTHTTCLVGDTLDDAHAARACGIGFVAYSGGYGWGRLRAELPGVERFDDFTALPGLLLGRGVAAEWPALTAERV